MNKNTFTAVAFLESTVNGLLWAVLCFVIIERFNLEDIWYVVCSCVLIAEIGILLLHQKYTFPYLITEHLGYEANGKLEEMKKTDFSDHIANILVMFAVVYFCIEP